MTAPRRLVLLRHGETADNAAGIWQGHRDSPLSARGVEQARRAAPVLAAMTPYVVVSSDLQRARRTAEAVARVAGLPVRTDRRLREIDVGAWSGRTNAQVREEDPATLDEMARGVDVRRGGTGETVAEVTARTREVADEVLADLPEGGLALLVSHGVAARALAASLLGLEPMLASRMLWGLGNVHWATVAEARLVEGAPAGPAYRLEQWNAGVTALPEPASGT